MKAVVLTGTGGPELLRLGTAPAPAVGPGEVRIAVRSCGVCFHDVVVRRGTLRRGVQFPLILGHEVAGVVETVGGGVTGFAIGDRVTATHHSHICCHCRYCRGGQETSCRERRFLGDAGLNGGYAELVSIGAENVVKLADGVGFDQAAITGCTIGTELNAIHDVGRVAPGERVLVTGAGGGLGLHGVQLARLAGAYTIGITTSPAKAARIRAAGADAVVMTRPGADFSEEVRSLTGGDGIDLAIDNVGSAVFEATRRSMADCGRIVLVGQLTGDFVAFNPAQLFLRNISLLSAKGVSRAQLVAALRLVELGRIVPEVAGALPLSGAAEAHRALEASAVPGRLVLRP